MDYEKILKEALNSNNTSFNVKCWIKKHFPELAESEDEKIRKVLVKEFKELKERDFPIWGRIKVDNILAWLEKQSKEKPFEEVNGEDYGIDGMYAALDILQKTLGMVDGYQTDDGILEHKAAITAVKKLSEQKPDTVFSDLKTWKYIVDAVLTEREGIGQYLDSPWTTEVAEKLQKRFGNITQEQIDNSKWNR